MDRRDLGSWWQGPGAPPGSDSAYPGERLGRPEGGRGSIAAVGRRLGSLVVDWLLCLVITAGFSHGRAIHGLWPVLVLVVENILLVGTAGSTLGQAVFGVRVESVDGSRPAPLPVVIRAVLLGLGVPALTLLWQQDRRGLHELASSTLVARR